MRISSLPFALLFVVSYALPIASTEDKVATIRDFDTLWTSEALFEDGTALIRRPAKRDADEETPAAELSRDEVAQGFIRRPAKRESDVSDTTDAGSISTDHLIRRPAKRGEEAATDEIADEAIVEAFIRRPAKRTIDSATDDSTEDETIKAFIRRPAKREASEQESTASTETSSVGQDHVIRRPAKRDAEPKFQESEESAIEDHLIRRPAKRDAEPEVQDSAESAVVVEDHLVRRPAKRTAEAAAQVVPGYASWGVYPRPKWQHQHPPAAAEAGPNLDRMVRRAA
ncbi:hypothetical protein KC331_g12213 [Hortaea werneckii]|nr:hypothetical protein KC331_g12213 [Hortaea werneckii]